MYDLRFIILRGPKVGLLISFMKISKFHSAKMIVTIENLYIFFNLKHEHLVICFTIKGICINAS